MNTFLGATCPNSCGSNLFRDESPSSLFSLCDQIRELRIPRLLTLPRLRILIRTLVVLQLFGGTFARAQLNDPASLTSAGQNANAILVNASAAFSSVAIPSEVIMDGRAQLIEGGLNEDVAVHLVARADGSYEITLDAIDGRRTERRLLQEGEEVCSWSGIDGIDHLAASHNCMLRATWFLPCLSMVSASEAGALYALLQPGLLDRDKGITLRQTGNYPDGKDLLRLQHLSSFDFVFSSDSYLPAAAAYSIHPDDDATSDIPVVISYTDYRQIAGTSIPFRIQQFVNGTLKLDITIQSASAQ